MNAMKYVFMVFISAYSILTFANDPSNPQFSDYQIAVSLGPFARKVHFDSEQKTYSKDWKKSILDELNRPVNFAGHYRLYTATGGRGSECANAAWVCGWVIDKLTGKIVSKLPKDTDGSSIYASVGDNGTPVGYPFEIYLYKDSTMVVITGQAIPADKSMNDNPGCKTVVYNFKNNEFEKLVESDDGCKIDK